MSDSLLKIAVLISGEGTTLHNLIEKIDSGQLPAQIVLVISTRADVGGLRYARNAAIDTLVVQRRDFSTTNAFSEAVFSACRASSAGLVALAGFLKHLLVPADFTNRVMNIHPALIPAFCGQGYYGRRVHQAVLDYGCKVTGCTVHFVDNQYDHGPVILQRSVPVCDGDAAETLAARVFEEECQAYPKALRLYAEGKLRVEGRHVVVDG